MNDAYTLATQALETRPTARVMVFIDGQNLYKTCGELFHHPLCHPHLLAEWLAGPRITKPVACRYYSGRPSQNIPSERTKLRNFDRRMNVFRSNRVTVETRPLRYHWDWGHQQNLPDPEEGAPPQNVILRPWQRPHEKGIDTCIALDVLEFSLTDKLDVAIVVSLDKDLAEIPRAIRNLKRFLPHPVRLEAAVPVEAGLSSPKTLKSFSRTHQITSELFSAIRDNTNYTVADDVWVPPVVPKTLAELASPPAPWSPTGSSSASSQASPASP